jgi:hypothetical protein
MPGVENCELVKTWMTETSPAAAWRPGARQGVGFLRTKPGHEEAHRVGQNFAGAGVSAIAEQVRNIPAAVSNKGSYLLELVDVAIGIQNALNKANTGK